MYSTSKENGAKRPFRTAVAAAPVQCASAENKNNFGVRCKIWVQLFNELRQQDLKVRHSPTLDTMLSQLHPPAIFTNYIPTIHLV